MTQFGELELGTTIAVGCVTSRSARIWVRVERLGSYRLAIESDDGMQHAEVAIAVEDAAADGTSAWTYPDDFGASPPLAPERAYLVTLLDGDSKRSFAEARFRTAPAGDAPMPPRWSFGAFSCHQPFSNRDSSVRDFGVSMLSAAHRALDDAQAQFLLLMGDQMYADYPPKCSLFVDDYFATIAPPGRQSILDCTVEEVRALYQRRHRQFWGLTPFQRVQSSFACYPMLDDHEVVDNFGTHPDHDSPRWERLREGALEAYFDYQGSRVTRLSAAGKRPSELDYGFRWAQAAIYVMDVRSQRRTTDGTTHVYSRTQLEHFRTFLAANAEAKLLVLMTSIPLIYLDGMVLTAAASLLSQGSDLHERWGHPQCVQSRDRLLRVLIEHGQRCPHQNILLLGGDVHSGGAYRVDFEGGPTMYQLISSAVSNHESAVLDYLTERVAASVSELKIENGPTAAVSMLPGVAGHDKNPYGGLNVGIVDVIDRGDTAAVELRLVGYDDDGAPTAIFQSSELTRKRN